MKRAPWIIILALLLLGTFEQWGDSALKEAAATERERADSIARARATVEAEATEMRRRVSALADTLVAARDSLATTRALAARTAADAAAQFRRAERNARVVAGDSAAAVALIDSMVVAHEREVQAKDEQVASLEAERLILWRRIEATDSLLAVQTERVASLEAEREALRRSVELYRSAASPSFLTRLKQNVEVGAVGVAIGAVAGFIIAEKVGGECRCSY